MHRDNNALVNIKRWHRCIEINDPIVSKEVPTHVPLVSELLHLLQANPVCTLAKMLDMTQLMTTAHMGLSENGVPPNSKGLSCFLFSIKWLLPSMFIWNARINSVSMYRKHMKALQIYGYFGAEPNFQVQRRINCWQFLTAAPDCLMARDTPMFLWVESRISAAQRDVNVPKRSPL